VPGSYVGCPAACGRPPPPRFLTRRLANVGTEMGLQVLAYNFKRVLSILGIARTMKAVRAMGE
jgi:hypothetical protein